MRILVTGSSGYIGTALCGVLTGAGHEVVGIDRRDPGDTRPSTFFAADLRDRSEVDRAFDQGIDLVAHLAAAKDDWGLSRAEYFDDNVAATRALLDSGRGRTERWLFFSTVGVLGPSAVPLAEESGSNPTTPYAESKLEAERLFLDLAADPGQAVTILRPSVVFGPEHPPSTNIYRLVEAIRRRRFVMVGSGEAVKSTSYLENLLAAAMFLIDPIEPGLLIRNYVDEPEYTNSELVQIVCGELGRRPPSFSVPLRPAEGLSRIVDRLGSATHIDFPITSARIRKFSTATSISADKIRDDGFEQPVEVREALARTVDWHRSRAMAATRAS